MALARLEETALERRAELCSAAVGLEAEQERLALYRDYSGPKQELLEWSEQMRSSGATDPAAAIGFELQQRVEIATREPLSVREEESYGSKRDLTEAGIRAVVEPGGKIRYRHEGLIDPLELRRSIVGYLGRTYH